MTGAVPAIIAFIEMNSGMNVRRTLSKYIRGPLSMEGAFKSKLDRIKCRNLQQSNRKCALSPNAAVTKIAEQFK